MKSTILQALARRRPERLPVWFMRQAGRSLPEYRELRAGTSMLDSCLNPEMAAEITMQPVRRHDVDAAIFFSDIMIPLRLAGVGVEIQPGVGPVLDDPIRTRDDVAKLPAPDFADASMITRAIELIRAELPDHKALLGFAGAPFTLAAYMVEGRPSKDHLRARALMHSDPLVWDQLMTWAATVSNLFLKVQVAAGADAVQLFDSWAGSVSRETYAKHVLPYSKLTLEGVTGPRIHFGTNTAPFLDLMAQVGVDAIGVDYRTPLDEAAKMVPGVTLQGNIDPAMLFAGQAALHEHALDVVRRGTSAPAHIVNLGHGVPKDTDPGVLTELVAFIHSLTPGQLDAEHEGDN
ncbi:MAG: uroporphyrinogen decarboxylase [Actinomycetaceae bacterium]|nr:uroporphyrinogen decarboxylase [Actinomycetaceae bacterium]